ncbi:hypothetical protein BJ508DRAFT_301998 [Ascobolus immersus RN42]|uniref:Uncharacterized protein n=1 Tax=Ascobolus immersus RN42 TaxID=1160509 RepID=A0A3N4IL82_ASCIM|nr:hypothetical protein BJ508DRAFT_301998 [Ascobolus immersus RN42]
MGAHHHEATLQISAACPCKASEDVGLVFKSHPFMRDPVKEFKAHENMAICESLYPKSTLLIGHIPPRQDFIFLHLIIRTNHNFLVSRSIAERTLNVNPAKAPSQHPQLPFLVEPNPSSPSTCGPETKLQIYPTPGTPKTLITSETAITSHYSPEFPNEMTIGQRHRDGPQKKTLMRPHAAPELILVGLSKGGIVTRLPEPTVYARPGIDRRFLVYGASEAARETDRSEMQRRQLDGLRCADRRRLMEARAGRFTGGVGADRLERPGFQAMIVMMLLATLRVRFRGGSG